MWGPWVEAPGLGSAHQPKQRPHTGPAHRGMRPLLLFSLVVLVEPTQDMREGTLPGPGGDASPEISIAYRVLEVYPQSRRVRITCHAPQVPPPVTYTLLASRGIQMAKKVVDSHQPASFNVNVTLKSSPDLLTYSCQAASTLGVHGPSDTLQMYWELWAKPLSQLQADFILREGGAGPRMEVLCQASSGSPPVTYSLVGKDGHVHMQQRPPHGQPANFSLPLSQTSDWFQCQAENSISVQNSSLTLVPPGELPVGPAFVLAGSLISIAASAAGMLGWIRL